MTATHLSSPNCARPHAHTSLLELDTADGLPPSAVLDERRRRPDATVEELASTWREAQRLPEGIVIVFACEDEPGEPRFAVDPYGLPMVAGYLVTVVDPTGKPHYEYSISLTHALRLRGVLRRTYCAELPPGTPGAGVAMQVAW